MRRTAHNTFHIPSFVLSQAAAAKASLVGTHRHTGQGPQMQVVALGCGYDTRPWLAGLGLEPSAWFSVDLPDVGAVPCMCLQVPDAVQNQCYQTAHASMVLRTNP